LIKRVIHAISVASGGVLPAPPNVELEHVIEKDQVGGEYDEGQPATEGSSGRAIWCGVLENKVRSGFKFNAWRPAGHSSSDCMHGGPARIFCKLLIPPYTQYLCLEFVSLREMAPRKKNSAAPEAHAHAGEAPSTSGKEAPSNVVYLGCVLPNP
jgi:hypothetical protein